MPKRSLFIAAILIWIIITGFSFFWNINLIDKHVNKNVEDKAKAFFNEIVNTRAWNASYGGVYVEVSDSVQPNPYLDTIGRELITTDNKVLTKINPAYMTRQIAEIAEKTDNIRYHITSLKPLRPQNSADEWEKKALNLFEEKSANEVFELTESSGNQYFRYMAPLMIEKSCLKCHEKQGYSLGQVRGGISVTIPAESHFTTAESQKITIGIVHLIVLLLGVGGLYYFKIKTREQISIITEKNRELEKEISERKSAERQLSILKRAVENSPATVVITDRNGLIKYVNPKFSETTGYTYEEAMGKNPRILKSGEQDDAFYKTLWETITAGKVWHGDFHNKRKSGEVYWEIASIAPILDENNEISHFVAVKDDITQRKKVENELQIAKEKAESANRAKSEFLANMSHEIRTPLNAILGFSAILKDKFSGASELMDYCDGIYNSGTNLLNLINDILDLSKIEAGKMEINHNPLNLKKLLNEISQIFMIKIKEKGLDMIIFIDENIPTVLLDEIRLRQVLFNFVGNAVKFTHQGEISISVTYRPRMDDSCIDLSISVKDTGIGIAEDQKRIIFKPFEQQKGQDIAKYGGTGLGLTISKRLVEMMGGSIELASKLNIGSVFTIHFPGIAISSVKVETGIEQPTTRVERFENSLIVLAEDIESNRKVVKGYLESFDIRILEAVNGLDALELAREHLPDLVLLDMQMPVMDGYEAIKELKADERTKNIPIVALTASAFPADIEKISSNCNGYLRKPVSRTDLIDHLAKFLPHKRKASPVQSSQIKEENINDFIREAKETVSFPKELIELLEGQLNESFIIARKSMSLSRIKEFARNLNEVGQKYEVEILSVLGKNLLEYANSFNFDRILAFLPVFEKIREIAMKKTETQ